jgi:hypothetical protein
MYESGLILKQDTHGRIFVPVQRLIELAQEFERNGLGALNFAAMAGVKYQTFVTWRCKHKMSVPAWLCLPIESGLLSTRSNCDFLANTAMVLGNIHSMRRMVRGCRGYPSLSMRRLRRRQRRSDPKPFLCRLLRRQFPVVAENDGGGIAGSGA